jgi:hypothetical protein
VNYRKHVEDLALELVRAAVSTDDVMRKKANPRTGIPNQAQLKLTLDDLDAVIERIREDYT